MRLRPPRSLRGRDSPLWLPVQGCYRVGIIAAQLHASEVSGRALAMAWAFRAGLVSGYWLMPSIGFLGRAAEYRPDNEAGWTGLFLRAVIEAAEWGLKLESHLRATHHRLLEMAARARTNSRMMPLADLLIKPSSRIGKDCRAMPGTNPAWCPRHAAGA